MLAMAASSLDDGSIREIACFGALYVVHFTVSDPSFSFFFVPSTGSCVIGCSHEVLLISLSPHLLCRVSVLAVECDRNRVLLSKFKIAGY
jgi:hypothetical protein